MADDKGEFVVDVTGKRLLEIVKAIIKSGPSSEKEAVDQFGEVMFTLALKDAELMKSFISDKARAASTSAEREMAAVMPADFDHCKRRRI